MKVAGFGSVGDDGVQRFWTPSRMVEDLTPTDYDKDYYFRADTQTANASFSYARPTHGRRDSRRAATKKSPLWRIHGGLENLRICRRDLGRGVGPVRQGS
jgi:hypothetical protein